MVLLIAVGATEGFWQAEAIAGAALEAEIVEVEESTNLARLGLRLKRHAVRRLPRRSARSMVPRVFSIQVDEGRPGSDGIETHRVSGRALLLEQSRLLI